MSNQSQNEDIYREHIEESDLGNESFDVFSKFSKNKEDVVKETFDEDVGESEENVINTPFSVINNDINGGFFEKKIEVEENMDNAVLPEQPLERTNPSIKESSFEANEETKPDNVESSIKESLMADKGINTEVVAPEQSIKESSFVANEENKTEINKESYLKESVVSAIKKEIEDAIKEEVPVVEEVKQESNIIKEEVPVVEEVKQESYKEIKDDLWNKINPSNENRFKLLNLEETDENRSLLNDISVKITFLDDDVEDCFINEEEALQKIKEIREKLKFLTK
ncbi:MAG: hypothetical protein PHG24_02960 [Candidatus Pacebacteria bacterium]|nr:hypothetical protein [Candidatus Paceibacterota bacterium]